MTDLDEKFVFQSPTMSNSLLESWVAEQSQRFDKLQRQLNIITSLPENSLDELADKLEDIDFHTAALSNILDLVVSTTRNSGLDDCSNQDDEFVEQCCDSSTPDSSQLKRWPLLYALWFHMIMIIDPESIYYSPRIGSEVWKSSF